MNFVRLSETALLNLDAINVICPPGSLFYYPKQQDGTAVEVSLPGYAVYIAGMGDGGRCYSIQPDDPGFEIIDRLYKNPPAGAVLHEGFLFFAQYISMATIEEANNSGLVYFTDGSQWPPFPYNFSFPMKSEDLDKFIEAGTLYNLGKLIGGV